MDGNLRKQGLDKTLEIDAKVRGWKKMLESGEFVKLRIMEKSMHPTITFGDVVEIKKAVFYDLKPGEIIFYRAGDEFIMRRITKRMMDDEGGFIVKGDNMPSEEPPVRPQNVIGKVFQLTRGGEIVVLESTQKKLAEGPLGDMLNIFSGIVGGMLERVNSAITDLVNKSTKK